MRPRPHLVLASVLLLTATAALGQDGPYKVEPLAEPAPADLAAPLKEALADRGVRVLDGQGKPFLDLWLRKATPASGKPSGPKGAVLYPVLAEGEFLGAARFAAEGHDYRDQAIEPGLYTLRYGLQPVNGDHLGVSTHRDYALLVPAAKDTAIEPLARKTLETRSAEAAGTNHPAVLMMLAPPGGDGATPALAHDEEKQLWGLVLPLSLTIPGEGQAVPLRVQVVIVGAAPV
jgi:hypothetical protein